jgi:hypothetical protein
LQLIPSLSLGECLHECTDKRSGRVGKEAVCKVGPTGPSPVAKL